MRPHGCRSLDARNHYPQIKHHTPPPKRSDNTPSHPQAEKNRLVVSKPNSVFDDPAPATPPTTTSVVAPEPPPLQHTAHPTNRSAHRTPVIHGRGMSLVVLLRKEVIQPHLPVRLPCYDFVPIADPTFDGSLPYGLGHRLRVLPTFMT